jgi:glycosyltransferase involved in cell wall biosynthesis
MKANVSVIILTRNEEKDLPDCLASVSFSDDIVIYDSFSSDNTQDIALSFGARFIQRPGQDQEVAYGGNEGFHRTWGIHQISYKHTWMFVIDADERLTFDAAAEIHNVAKNPDPRFVAYRICRRDFFQGRELKHVQTSPFYIRFF